MYRGNYSEQVYSVSGGIMDGVSDIVALKDILVVCYSNITNTHCVRGDFILLSISLVM